ncbi:HmuY family protein [Agriterribacter sp.]|uniref:HmuY family protein n=1 Tax=Agriterribacter sp. TaxID=2821509 RepID=UPI002C7B9046|nr:HmuY family protein [Agriterribacter sp.]HRO48337.1 HmuY family protein [Agriterribacter sp.]HRQ19424.1 HmuY family protein [Agriterribacter sp.]
MLSTKLKIGLAFSLGLFLLAAGCRKKDAPLPDNLVQFESGNQGLAAAIPDITVKLKLTRAASSDIPVTISITPTGVAYTTDFTTAPAASSGTLSLTIPSGSSETSFTLTKTPGILLEGTEQIVFKIESSGSPVIIGSTNIFTLQFAEIISSGAAITGDGGGATYANKVFFDLSANSQTAVLRTKWDLGFYSGDDWRVILNSSTGMMAKQIDKNDLNDVTAADTIDFSTQVIFNQFEPDVAALPYIDYPDGDLAKTAIAEISATASDNKVYIVNRGKGIGTPAPDRGWKKIRISRNGSGGYTLQHADIGATSFTSVDIPKNADYFFNYVSFETGAAEVEPQKTKWDIAWTYFSNVTDFGGGEVPYTFQDIVLHNRNVTVAKVLTSAKAYDVFAEADIASQTFVTTQSGIGADWRSGGGPGTAPFVRDDRYYIIKDGDNNYYKLRFTAMTKDGERGYPAFEYALVKSGE